MSRRIDDHAFWAGKGSSDSVFPKGVHTKSMKSAEGAGEMDDYPDTEEDIRKDQDEAISKAKRHEMKAGYRQ